MLRAFGQRHGEPFLRGMGVAVTLPWLESLSGFTQTMPTAMASADMRKRLFVLELVAEAAGAEALLVEPRDMVGGRRGLGLKTRLTILVPVRRLSGAKFSPCLLAKGEVSFVSTLFLRA